MQDTPCYSRIQAPHCWDDYYFTVDSIIFTHLRCDKYPCQLVTCHTHVLFVRQYWSPGDLKGGQAVSLNIRNTLSCKIRNVFNTPQIESSLLSVMHTECDIYLCKIVLKSSNLKTLGTLCYKNPKLRFFEHVRKCRLVIETPPRVLSTIGAKVDFSIRYIWSNLKLGANNLWRHRVRQ